LLKSLSNGIGRLAMITGTVISGYYPVNSLNNSLNNLIAGSVIKALILKIFDENILLKLADGSLLKAKVISIGNINVNVDEHLDLYLSIINNSNTTDNSSATNNSSTANNPSVAYEDTHNQKGAFLNFTGIILQKDIPQLNKNNRESSEISSFAKYVQLKNIFKAGDILNLKVIKRDSNLILFENTEAIYVESSTGGEHVHEQHKNHFTKTVPERSELSSTSNTNNMANEINRAGNEISELDWNNSIKINKFLTYDETNEVQISATQKNPEIQNNEFTTKEFLHKEFLSKTTLKNELINNINKDALHEIIKTLDSLKKADIVRTLNSVKNTSIKISDPDKSVNVNDKTEKSDIDQDKADKFVFSQGKNDDNPINTQNKNRNYQFMSVEIPIHYEGQKFGGKLYFIRKNYTDNKKNAKMSNEPFTACLLLDFQNLGLVQAMISLKHKSVYIHMKVEHQYIADLIHTNYAELYSTLKSKGYFLLNLKCDLLKPDIFKNDTEHLSRIDENIEKELYNYHTSIDFRV